MREVVNSCTFRVPKVDSTMIKEIRAAPLGPMMACMVSAATRLEAFSSSKGRM